MSKDESSEKIHQALELLNEAAKDKRQELAHILVGKYDSVKEVFSEAIEKGKVAANKVDNAAHQKPWHFAGGAAALGLLVGLILRRKR